MKKFIFLISVLFLGSCDVGKTHEEKCFEWINNHARPIKCKSIKMEDSYRNQYLLMDVDGQIYNTGWLYITLPDTIKIK